MHLLLIILARAALASLLIGVLLLYLAPRLSPRAYRWYGRWKSLIHVILAIVVLVFGFAGFAQQEAHSPAEHYADWPLFRAVQLFALNSGAEEHNDNLSLVIARDAALVWVMLIAVDALAALFSESLLALRLLVTRHHAVICGLGRIGSQLLSDLIARREMVVVIERDSSNSNVRWARELGAVIVSGDATDADVLKQVAAHRAAEVFFTTGEDAANMEAAFDLYELRQRLGVRDNPKNGGCYVHLLDTELAEVLQSAPHLQDDALPLHTFNARRNSAERLLTDDLLPFRPRNPDQVMHAVVVGFGSMGRILALKLAELGHFENRKRMRMTIVSDQPRSTIEKFRVRYPRFAPQLPEDFDGWSFAREADRWESQHYPAAQPYGAQDPRAIEYVCNGAFIDAPADIVDERFISSLARLAHDGIKPAVFICLEHDRDSVTVGQHLRARLALYQVELPVFAWIPKQRLLAELVRSSRTQHPAGIRNVPLLPFGECHHSCNYVRVKRSLVEQLAEIIHEDYRSNHCQGQESKPQCQPWSHLIETFRSSNRSAAAHVQLKLAPLNLRVESLDVAKPAASVAFSNDALELLAEMEHYRWVSERLLTGWRYAPQSQNQLLQRSQITAWNNLSDADKQKDIEQVRRTLSFCTSGSFKIVPHET